MEFIPKLSKDIGVPIEDLVPMIRNALLETNSENTLIEILGLDHIEEIFSIIKHKDDFLVSENVSEDYYFVEHTLQEQKTVKHDQSELIPVAEMGSYRKYFEYEKFNIVQSKVYDYLINTNFNTLICAPTGAGKTDMALIAIIRVLKNRKGNSKDKIIYMVPMKALATEITEKYKNKLKEYSVIEYTGDTEIPAHIANNADLIICTPEKFDVSTRRLYPTFRDISLVVIDEIHLLGEDRGPVLESLVSRIFMMSENDQRTIRIVGLSATLPNYKDVGQFLRCENVFYFGNSFRPVPLKITVTGFKKQAKEIQRNEYLFSKIREFREAKKQVLVFVHSRIKTLKVAKLIMNEFVQHKYKSHPQSEDSSSDKEKTKIKTRKSTGFQGDLDILVLNKIGIHHAGMPRKERLLIETLFKEGSIDVLVCTSTLAWGVNLPANGVIIFGSTFYNPEIGSFDNLGILDVIQIFGRAGRPQYDSSGSAILITESNVMGKYLQQLKGSKDIESKMLYHVTDALGSEIYLGNVYSLSTALLWIKNTFLYVRMHKNPAMYGLCREELAYDEQALSEYIHLTIRRLHDCGIIQINNISEEFNMWRFNATVFGRIAATYYLSHETVNQWLNRVESVRNELSILELLMESKELSQISIRPEENHELSELHKKLILDCAIDFDYDGSAENKRILLAIAHLRYIKMVLFTLQCDTTFMVERMEILFNAFGEVLLIFKKYEVFKILLNLQKRFLHQRPEKIKRGFTAIATDLKGFIHLDIGVNDDDTKNLLVYSGNDLIFADIFKNYFSKFIESKRKKLRIEVHGTRTWTISEMDVDVNPDLSLNGLYKYGLHHCDSIYTLCGIKNECIHFYTFSQSKRIEELEKIRLKENEASVKNRKESSNELEKINSTKSSNDSHTKEEQKFESKKELKKKNRKIEEHKLGKNDIKINKNKSSEQHSNNDSNINANGTTLDALANTVNNNMSENIEEKSKNSKEEVRKLVNNDIDAIIKQIKEVNLKKNYVANNSDFNTVITNNKELINKEDRRLNIKYISLDPSSVGESYGKAMSFDFKLLIRFIEVERSNYRESLRRTSAVILSELLEDEMLIVCPDRYDSEDTLLLLNTKLALKNDFSHFELLKATNSSKRVISTFEDALNLNREFKTVILKRCSDSKRIFPFYQIFKLIDRQNSIIFEDQTFLEYLKSIVN